MASPMEGPGDWLKDKILRCANCERSGRWREAISEDGQSSQWLTVAADQERVSCRSKDTQLQGREWPIVSDMTNAEDMVDAGSILGSEKPPGGGNDNPLQYSCLENPMDRGAWQATIHGVAKRVGRDCSDLACTLGMRYTIRETKMSSLRPRWTFEFTTGLSRVTVISDSVRAI